MSEVEAPVLPRLPRLALLLLFVGSFGLFGLTAHGYLENSDAQITMHAARAWWLRGSPGLVGAGDAQLLADGAPTWPAEQAIVDRFVTDPDLPRYGRVGRDGRSYVWFPIGHQALMVPGIALAGQLDAAFPAVEARFRAQRNDPLFGEFFWDRFVLSFLSPLFAAGSVVCLLVLCLALGASLGPALLATAVAVLCTQFWPGTSESMSDMPGTFFLLAPAALIALYARGREADALLWAGVLGGAGVLLRYPQALPLCGLGAYALWVALRRGRALDFAWFVVGGLPMAALLAYANLWRFGDAAETGYSGGVGFFSYPLEQGLPSILFATGKGILWFSLPLWLAFAQFGKAEVRRRAAPWFALATLAAPLPLYATLHYWAAGQCWGIRYLTGVVVLFVAVTLALGRPWRTSPRAFWLISGLGFLLSLGGHLSPYRGHQGFAYPAAAVHWQADPNTLNDNVNWDPRFTPLHGHWNYARLAATGRIESGRSADTTEPLFGVAMPDGTAPRPSREDAGFRHLWWRYLEDLWPEFPGLAAAGGLALGSLLVLAAALWRLGAWARREPAHR
jgi:hypothetical protein